MTSNINVKVDNVQIWTQKNTNEYLAKIGFGIEEGVYIRCTQNLDKFVRKMF